MSENIKRDFWDSVKEALKYTFQSAKGRYSIDSYLEVLSQFTDSEINDALDHGDLYGDGEVTFETDSSQDRIKATVEMRFFNTSEMKNKIRRAERYLDKKMFTTEAIEFLNEKGIVQYSIDAPRRE